MEWRDQGTLLSVRRHGETSVIIDVFTPSKGRFAGVVRGGTSRKLAPILQPGAELSVAWRARLEAHLGAFTVEPVRTRAALVMGDRLALAGLNSITALLGFCVPEREPHPSIHQSSSNLLDLLSKTDAWPLAYLRWEADLLEEMGYGLDLRRCAVTGSRDNLVFVSPKSGKAVSREGAGEWADRLLPLPQCMLGQGPASDADIVDGLRTTGYFLANGLAASVGDRPLPAARQRLIDLLAR
ncbi:MULTISPECIES: DNA repair protein RecO [Halocynthiibacter]|uniref:DNA repair protein RecO n=1 Tax=Halocynthiibacter halioticoli TaxID=2986804 RepID=A0AAE3IW40_9RHOB|nr:MULTISPECIES: DNA repair protein RecO [Halocynthiibacter]MCV6823267.1 DNA repair protein RecO [Halocynthiibacter halioticoli]MCW4056268.1 DNA repair protein RecO [Halocynthiibacter sp. SDUM655004]